MRWGAEGSGCAFELGQNRRHRHTGGVAGVREHAGVHVLGGVQRQPDVHVWSERAVRDVGQRVRGLGAADDRATHELTVAGERRLALPIVNSSGAMNLMGQGRMEYTYLSPRPFNFREHDNPWRGKAAKLRVPYWHRG